MIEKINRVNKAQIYAYAILDLMRAADDSIDVESIHVAADICMSFLDEAAADMEDIENEWKEKKRGAKDEK